MAEIQRLNIIKCEDVSGKTVNALTSVPSMEQALLFGSGELTLPVRSHDPA
jgi:hypothetical protein